MEKLKLKQLHGVFGMLLFFGILKICGFVYVRINCTLQLQSRRNKQTNFAKLALARYFNSAFLFL